MKGAILNSDSAAAPFGDLIRRALAAVDADRERIVRPGGQVRRHLLPDGQAVPEASGCPLRLDMTVFEPGGAEPAGEALAATLREAQLRRRQGLEINDNIVQGLVAAVLAVQQADAPAVTSHLQRALSAARQMMNDWLDRSDGEALQPGDLVRTVASASQGRSAPNTGDAGRTTAGAGPLRLLVADDNCDVRQLLRAQIEALGTFDVIEEAADGEEAVRVASALQPQVVLLDLSMPRMDGLQALPLILAAVDGVQVIVMSGFDRMRMAEQVLAAGAARYVEKGLRMNLAAVIDEVLHAPPERAAPRARRDSGCRRPAP